MNTEFFLINKMKQGDEHAIEVFVRRYYGEILSYCRHRCFDVGAAEDLTQETFARFLESLARYVHIGKAKNYLYTIAGNLCKDFYKRKTEVPWEASEELQTNPIPQWEEKLWLEWAFRKLPPELAEVLILYYFQDLKQKEIAGILGIGLPLVKYRINRGKELLRDILREEAQGQDEKE